MAIDLWAARLERALTEQECERILQILPSGRKERLMKLRQEEKRQEVLCAYWVLHLALRERYQWERVPEMAQGNKGKPYFPEHPEVHFNLSHTAGAVLVGVSDQPIGVDLEKIRPVSRRTMHRLEAGVTEEEFFRSWVRREARTKRSGEGIGAMMRGELPLQQGEVYYELDTFPGYVAGVATGEGAPPEVRKYTLEELF